jgi:hypothetical protein
MVFLLIPLVSKRWLDL